MGDGNNISIWISRTIVYITPHISSDHIVLGISMWLIDLDSEMETFFIKLLKNIFYACLGLLVTDSFASYIIYNDYKSILNPQHKVMTMSNQ